MENKWVYKNYEVKEGLKPGAEHFQYFFLVTEGGEKKCNYCVWIEDNALQRFDSSKNFDTIVSSQREVCNVELNQSMLRCLSISARSISFWPSSSTFRTTFLKSSASIFSLTHLFQSSLWDETIVSKFFD